MMVTYSFSTGGNVCFLIIVNLLAACFLSHSMSGHRVISMFGTHFYSATKYAVTAITEGLRQELREMKSGIKITVSNQQQSVTLITCMLHCWTLGLQAMFSGTSNISDHLHRPAYHCTVL